MEGFSQKPTSMWRLASVPDENSAVVRRAGEDVVVDGADGQAVDGVDVQEDVQGLPPAGTGILR